MPSPLPLHTRLVRRAAGGRLPHRYRDLDPTSLPPVVGADLPTGGRYAATDPLLGRVYVFSSLESAVYASEHYTAEEAARTFCEVRDETGRVASERYYLRHAHVAEATRGAYADALRTTTALLN